jgi:hypothetical protein
MATSVAVHRPFLNETMLALTPAGTAACIACGGILVSANEATDPQGQHQVYMSLFCNKEGCFNAFRNAGEFGSNEEMNDVLRHWALHERARLGAVGHNDRFSVAFGVLDEPGGPVLCCTSEANFESLGFASGAGRRYDNWRQLTGTLSDILGRPAADFVPLKESVCRNQQVTRRQLRLLGIPSMRHLMSAG